MVDENGKPPFVLQGFRIKIQIYNIIFYSDRNLRTSVKKLKETIWNIRELNLEQALIQMKLSKKKNAKYVFEALKAVKEHAINYFNQDERLLAIEKFLCLRGRIVKHPGIKGISKFVLRWSN